MPEAEIGEGPKPEIVEKPEKQVVSRLGASLEKVRGLSWETVKAAIKGRLKKTEKEAKKEGAEPKQIAELGLLRQQIEESAKVLLEKGEGFDVGELSRQTREWIKAQKEKAPSEALGGLEELEKRMDDFDTRQILGELSTDPEMLVKQMFFILAGPEGRDLVEMLAEVVNEEMQEQEREREEGEEIQEERGEEKPYPWEPRPELKIGKSRWVDPRFLGCLLPLSCCIAATILSPLGKHIVGRERMRSVSGDRVLEWVDERGRERAKDQMREKDARGLILGTYPYSAILGLEEQGNEDLAFARLDRAAEFIKRGEYSLDQIHDPQLIARLIHDERYKKYGFSLDQIKDPEKHRKVEELLKELETKEKEEESSLRPSLRKTAEARARQRLTSAQTRARKKVLSRRERGLV